MFAVTIVLFTLLTKKALEQGYTEMTPP